jgi:SAM-dependent methyltransferase
MFQRSLKELVRHSLTRSGLTIAVRQLCGQNVEHLKGTALAERFEVIYKNEIWRNGRKSGSLSGLGSELSSTETIRAQLPSVLDSINTKTLLDIGCGDFTWMKEVDLHCNYIGVDIVRGVIADNSARYGGLERKFSLLDATSELLPNADTILCREVLFHLSFLDIGRLLGNIRLTGAKFLLATSDANVPFNADIISGDFRILNLRAKPLCFPRPQLVIADTGVSPDRSLSLWKLSSIPVMP